MLTTYCILSFAILSTGRAYGSCVDAAIAFAYLTNWAKVFSIHTTYYLLHTWSLCVEEQFYIIWPLILLTLLRSSKRRSNIALFAGAIALLSWLLRVYLCGDGAPLLNIYIRLDTRADSLMVGCALGLILLPCLKNAKTRKVLEGILVIWAPLAFAGILGISLFADVNAPAMYYFGFVLVELLAAV